VTSDSQGIGEKPMPSSDKPTSNTLLERIRARDEEAWRRLLHLYTPLVLHWCEQWGVRGQDADDITQDVFQAVAVGLERFHKDQAGDTFRGWLRGITRNKLLDYFRRRQNQPEAQGGTHAQRLMHEVAEQQLSSDSEEILGGLYRRALELVQSEFENRTWEAFWRSAVDGQAAADVASDLGMTPAAVRKAKSRVLHRLRQEVGELLA
jgi:RNA polymerase sigma-70 factor, ECF subfamily